ncbi:biotin--[acetyl-CoA-carboxylase] ligase [Massilia sp. 9I]|uniref:biotin--[acetyl-CoA-carboxylase] ligase n=1 Tax=Massilia sp. 9I TaxID=2653152 RepID=UPI0012F214C9|nr:biotin--[acetyl-CoA-carboxylase] ligase [Massilia sp. 9I]VXB52844.1 Biotin-protein ligase [Massilia sp. 9I]
MNADRIASLSHAGVRVEVVPETGSTNADLLARAAQLSEPLLLVAEHQSAGRGRAGRSWLSSSENSLTFSLAWKFDGGPSALAGLPLAIGVALGDALAALGVQVQLKWPNDVLKDGAKLAGILIETQSAPNGGTWAVIGIGLNLIMPDEVEARLGRSAAGAPWLARMERDVLMAALLDALADALRLFARQGFAAFSARWNLRHAWQGQLVVILDNGQVLQEGLAAGVDDTGRLLLDTVEGRTTVLAGDVSLRVKE